MKRITVILFTLLYLVSISGLAVNNFYCCGKYKESFVFHSKALSKFCKGNKLPGCCDTKTVLVKLKDNHSPSQQIKISFNDFLKNIFINGKKSDPSLNLSQELLFLASIHAPPLISNQPVYLSVCSFRI